MNKLLHLIVALFFFYSASYAQWITYRSDNTAGLSSDLVSSVHEGVDGSLWFGTDNGVVKYDRNNNTWNRFTTTNGLGDNFIYDVKSFSSNTIWIATNGGGVSRYIAGAWTTLTTNDGLASNTVRAITRSNSGKIWFATYGGGLSRLYNSQWVTYNTANGMPTDYFYSAFTDADGNLWFGTSNHGVMKFDTIWTNYTDADGLAGNTILSISQTVDGRMLFAGTNGVSIYDGNTWETITPANGLPASLAYCVMEDAEGNLRIGTDNGMSIYDGNTLTNITTSSGIASDKVYCMLQDSYSDIWLGHLENGASHYDGTQWLNYHNATGLVSNQVYECAEDMNGTMWFRTGSAITKYDGLNWTTYTGALPGLPGTFMNNVIDMETGPDGKIWLATYNNGLYYYDGTDWSVIYYGQSTYTSQLFIDSQNNVWVANNSNYGTVARYNGTNWYYYSNSSGYSGSYCYDMYEDATGKIWFATSDGLYTYQNGVWDNYNDVQHSYFKNIKSITGDENGNVWFAYYYYTYLNGYSYYYNGLIKNNGHWWYNIYDDNLHTTYPNALCFTSTDELWMGGTDYSNSTALTVIAPDEIRYHNTYSEIASSRVYHIYEDSHQNIWICTDNGITKGNLLTVGIDNPKPESNVAVFPNPFSDQTSIVFEMQDAGTALFEVYDVTGKLVFNTNYHFTVTGKNTITFDGSNADNGIYFFRINTLNKLYSGKMNIIH